MEDFGYQKNYDGEDKFRNIAKRIFLSLAALFSVAAFIYVTISAYHYVYEDANAEVETIKSPEKPIKVFRKETRDENSMQINRKIYEDIFGSRKTVSKTKVKNSPEPARPPKAQEIAKNIPERMPERMPEKMPEKMIVFSNAKTKENPKDLLTKTNGEKRDNTAAPAKKRSGKKAKVRVQVAAMASDKAAQKNWRYLNRSYPTVFDGLKPFVKKVDLGKRGIFYRLQIGDFFNQIEAEKFCRRYVAAAKKSRADCIVVE